MIDPKAVRKALMTAKAIVGDTNSRTLQITDPHVLNPDRMNRGGAAKGEVDKIPHKKFGGDIDDEGVPDFTPPKLRGTQIMKEPGGQWLSGGVEDSMSPLKTKTVATHTGTRETPESAKEIAERGIANIEQRPEGDRDTGMIGRFNDMIHTANRAKSVNDFVGKQLTRYVKNDMGTEHDPVRALAERGILHVKPYMLRRYSNDPSIKKFGNSEHAKAWENASDSAIYSMRVDDLDDDDSILIKRDPWLKKLDPNTEVHGLVSDGMHKDLGFDHLIDELHNSVNPESGLPDRLQLRPESLARMSVPQAVQHVHNINKWREDNIAEANKKLAFNEATHLHKDYPGTDYAWYEIKHPEMTDEEKRFVNSAGSEDEKIPEELERKKDALEEALGYEGDCMGHCVGGYSDEVADGSSRIFSLRNKKTGAPHVTIETKPQSMTYSDLLHHLGGNESLADEYLEKGTKLRDETNSHQGILWHALELAGVPHKDSIIQIKGKLNAKPVSRYIPYVQDFVRSGEWGDIGDLPNTELKRMDKMYSGLTDKMRAAGEHVPKFMTKEEFEAAEKRHFPHAFAAGGAIIAKASGGVVDPQKAIRRAMMLARSLKSGGGRETDLPIGDEHGTQTAPVNSEVRPEAGEIPFGRRVRGGSGVLPAQVQASGTTPLQGLPQRVYIPDLKRHVIAGPNPLIHRIARQYTEGAGIRYQPSTVYHKVDPARATRIADAYSQAEDNREHPLVKAAYAQLAKETMAQYEAARRAGFRAEFWHPKEQDDPYDASPRLALEDLNKNHHMYIFPTDFGYGTDEHGEPRPPTEEEIARTPLLADSGERWNGHIVRLNDIFRAVHDYFGHGKDGVGFRADGEENAWRSHAGMYSPLARLAITSETRGQNSWLNYGPHGEHNRKAKTKDTIFAQQKHTILPPWVQYEGAEDITHPDDIKEIHSLIERKPRQDGGRNLVEGTLGKSNQDPVTFMGKQPHELTPAEWAQFGEHHGVANMGPSDSAKWRRSLQRIKTRSGKTMTVPGGINNPEPFSYYDMLHLKSQGIDPNDLDPEVHQKIHDRMISAMHPKGKPSNIQIANQMMFGMISPNQPLTPNELALQRIMVKGPKDMATLASMIPYSYKDEQPASIKKRQEYSRGITTRLGLHAAERGGLGASGSANYSDIAEFMQKMRDNPEFFTFDPTTAPGNSPSEKWSNHVAKVLNEVRGLGAKTGSLASVWQSPKDAAISAIDRHMATKFKDNVFEDPKQQREWEKKTLNAFNVGRKKKDHVKSIDQLLNTQGGRGHFVDSILAHVNTLPTAKTRVKKTGEYNPRIPEALRNIGWVSKEPETMSLLSGPYVRALEENQRHANAAGQGLFSNQWMQWDRIRNRLEPHEILFPGLEKMPRMSLEQMRRVRDDLAKAGYMAPEGTVEPLPSASHAGYFSHGGIVDQALRMAAHLTNKRKR